YLLPEPGFFWVPAAGSIRQRDIKCNNSGAALRATPGSTIPHAQGAKAKGRPRGRPFVLKSCEGSVAAEHVDGLAAAPVDGLRAAAGHIGPVGRRHARREAMRPIPRHVINGGVADLVRSAERSSDRRATGGRVATVAKVAVARPEEASIVVSAVMAES